MAETYSSSVLAFHTAFRLCIALCFQSATRLRIEGVKEARFNASVIVIDWMCVEVGGSFVANMRVWSWKVFRGWNLDRKRWFRVSSRLKHEASTS